MCVCAGQWTQGFGLTHKTCNLPLSYPATWLCYSLFLAYERAPLSPYILCLLKECFCEKGEIAQVIVKIVWDLFSQTLDHLPVGTKCMGKGANSMDSLQPNPAWGMFYRTWSAAPTARGCPPKGAEKRRKWTVVFLEDSNQLLKGIFEKEKLKCE